MTQGKERERLDVLLVRRGLVASRERAKRLIMAGQVLVNGQRVDKSGTKVDAAADIEVRGEDIPYVSRGGLKLAKALEVFQVDPTGKVAIDVGASTGGFTDCLLQNGARKVYAIDVGYGQLAWKLRQDPRVVVRERTNIRHVRPEDLDELAELATIDVAFISLTKIFGTVAELLVPGADLICLVKPQFEAGPELVSKGGIVRDPEVHREVITRVIMAAEDVGFTHRGLTYSPVTGADGNIEFLAHFVRLAKDNAALQTVSPDGGSEENERYSHISKVVSEAWQQLKDRRS